ncbi:MAG: hypothetical protein QXQ50_04520 [Candidatus Bathyarchaeia archaeon]
MPSNWQLYTLTRFYCGKCCLWVKLESAVYREGALYCPYCNLRLRITHRNSRNKNKEWKRIKHHILRYYELHHKVPDYSKILIKRR